MITTEEKGETNSEEKEVITNDEMTVDENRGRTGNIYHMFDNIKLSVTKEFVLCYPSFDLLSLWPVYYCNSCTISVICKSSWNDSYNNLLIC